MPSCRLCAQNKNLIQCKSCQKQWYCKENCQVEGLWLEIDCEECQELSFYPCIQNALKAIEIEIEVHTNMRANKRRKMS